MSSAHADERRALESRIVGMWRWIDLRTAEGADTTDLEAQWLALLAEYMRGQAVEDGGAMKGR